MSLTPPLSVQKLQRALHAQAKAAYGRERWLGELTQELYRAVDRHLRKRLRQWLCTKHKVTRPGTKRFPEALLYQLPCWVCLPGRTANFPWANA
jgi:hypothetical protein